MVNLENEINAHLSDNSFPKQFIEHEDGEIEDVTEHNRKTEAERIFAEKLLDDLQINDGDYSKKKWKQYKDGYLKDKVSFEIWEKYWEEKQEKPMTFSDKYEFFNWKENKDGTEYIVGVDVDYTAIYLIKKHKFVTWFGIKNDYCFNWDGKVMCENSRGIIKYDCENILGEYCKKSVVEEVFDKIKRKTKIDRQKFENTDTNFINFNNGVWDIQNKRLLPHDPKYNFQFIIPINKDDNTLNVHNCPNWLKFINETLYPEDVPVMQEWFGFVLFREYFIKKGLINDGEQNTGKSVVMDTLIKFIGESNKTGLSLQKITTGSDFTKLSLKNKHLNAYDDLSSKDVSDGGAFKVATGGGYISGEEKFGEYQQFRSFAKQMFNANKCPPVKDNDDPAYFGRWIILKFDNVPEKIDPFLRNKLWTDEELSGMLNWSLEGLYRLLENGNFSYNKTHEEVKQMMEISGCPLVAFSSEVLEKENDNVITKDMMYNIYSIWCEINKRPRLSKEMLGRNLTKYCNFIIPDKHKERVWKNAKISEKFSKMLNINQILPFTDTSDTFQKNMRNICKSSKNDDNMNNIKLKEVSEVSVKKTEKNDDFEKLKAEYEQGGIL